MKLAACLAVLLALPFGGASRAAGAPSAREVVRGWFQAIAHQDFDGALALTRGPAQASTAAVVGALTACAARHHAALEVKVNHLELAAPPAAGRTVTAIFDIDVIGKKWFFRAAKKLQGVARFRVAGDARIVAIDGSIE